MISKTSERFLKDIDGDVPTVALLKYRGYIKKKQKEAEEILPQMLKLSLDNQLIGEYEMIHNLLDKKTENTPEYREIRD